jgi:hypothetical protein
MSADLIGASIRPEGASPGYIPRQATMPMANSLAAYLTENFIGKAVTVSGIENTWRGTLTAVLEQSAGGPLSLVIDSQKVIPYAQVAFLELKNPQK